MPLESQIVNRILNYLNNEVPDCVAEKVMGNAFQFGRPDINGCWGGRSFRIEVKTPDHGNKPTKAQILNLAKWEKAGAICFVAYSLEDVKEVIGLAKKEVKWTMDTRDGKPVAKLSYEPKEGMKIRTKKGWWRVTGVFPDEKKALCVPTEDPHGAIVDKKGGKKR